MRQHRKLAFLVPVANPFPLILANQTLRSHAHQYERCIAACALHSNITQRQRFPAFGALWSPIHMQSLKAFISTHALITANDINEFIFQKPHASRFIPRLLISQGSEWVIACSGRLRYQPRAIERFFLVLEFSNPIYISMCQRACDFCFWTGAPNVTSSASCSAHVHELGRGPW